MPINVVKKTSTLAKYFIFIGFLNSAYADIDKNIRYGELAPNKAGINIQWGYKGEKGPERWAELSPSFSMCAKGKSQSPINITKKVTETPFALKINYLPAPLTIVNDGQTKVDLGDIQPIIYSAHSIQVNFSSKDKESISFENNKYRLIQFHIHTPSENQWHGQSFPLEIHLVHQGEPGKVLVIGVFAKGGAENPELQKLVDRLPTDKGKAETIAGVKIDPSHLLPSKLDYYRFAGSLNTPPCLEGLDWLVLANPITVSPAQIVKLKRAIGGVNARPVQPLHGRTIYFARENN